MRLPGAFFVLPSLLFAAVPAFAQDVQIGAWEAGRDPTDGVCKASIDIVDATNGGGYVFGFPPEVGVAVYGVGVDLRKAWLDADGDGRIELKCEQNMCVPPDNDIFTPFLLLSLTSIDWKTLVAGLELERADGIRVGRINIPLSELKLRLHWCSSEPTPSPETLPPLPDNRFLNPEPEVAPLPR